jgi:O-Antigen ligase
VDFVIWSLGGGVRIPWRWTFLAVAVGLIAGLAAALVGPTAGLFLVVGVPASLAAVTVAVRMPGVLLAAYLLVPFYKGAVQAYVPVDITVLLALLNGLQVIPAVLDHRPRSISRAGIALWVGVACLVLAGVTYAPDQNVALIRAANYWALVFVPLLPAAWRVTSDPRFVRQLLWTFFSMSALTVVLGLFLLSSSARLVVLGMDTIQTADAALLVPILGITFVLRDRSLVLRGATLVLIPAAILVALASGSRGPLLALVALGALAMIRIVVRPRSVDWRLAGSVAGLALASTILVSLAAVALPAASTERISRIGNVLEGGLSGASDPSGATRLTLYSLALSFLEQQPILGVGTSGFQSLSPRFLPALSAVYPQNALLPLYPHNALLQFGAEYGLVGVALFVAIVLLALTRRVPRESSWTALQVAFLFFLLEAMISGNILEDRMTWGLLLLLLLVNMPRVVQVPDDLAATPSAGKPGDWPSR